jgi:hypothetical protein
MGRQRPLATSRIPAVRSIGLSVGNEDQIIALPVEGIYRSDVDEFEGPAGQIRPPASPFTASQRTVAEPQVRVQ